MNARLERARLWAHRVLDDERVALWLFALATAASAGLLLALGANLSFLLDEWSFIAYRDVDLADALLEPHNEHIVVIPSAIYRLLIEVFGIGSELPFRLVAIAAFLLSATLLFVWLRRRLGAWPALAGATLVLFLGAAWEDLLWPFQLGLFCSMAAGLGALLALDRGDRTGDRAACALLCVSVLSGSLGIAFAVGCGVAVLLSRPPRLVRLYVAAVPLGLYLLWWAGWGHEAETAVTLENIVSSPLYVFDSIAASISGLLGLATPRDETAVGPLDWGRPLAALALALMAWRLWRTRSVSPALGAVVAAGLTFWLLAAFNEVEARSPVSSRYLYMGGIFVLLVGAELARGMRIGRGAVAGMLAVVAIAVPSNVSYLEAAADSYEATSNSIRGALTAVEIARDRVHPDLILTEELTETAYVHIEAGEYLAAAEHGSAALEPEDLATAPEATRRAADKVLSAALGLTFDPRIERRRGAACEVVRPARGAPATTELLPGGAVIEAGDGALELRARRYATELFAVTVGALDARGSGELTIPTDSATQPWTLELSGEAPARVCARESG